MRLPVLTLIVAVAAGLAGCAFTSRPREAPPEPAACPKGPPADARCWRGRDSAGAHYLMVMPARWNGVLVVHAHGGPVQGEPTAARADADIARWAITVQEGYAWVGSVFRQGGFAVTSAAEDTERVRRIFVRHVGIPRRVLLHGQSWGAMVATRAAERYPRAWDGVLLTSGVVGGVDSYDFRLDLRLVYQYICRNLPRPGEPAYPSWMGLGPDARLTRADVDARADECLGAKRPAAQRTPEQAARLRQVARVVGIPEASVLPHLHWATFALGELVTRYGGASPLGNVGVLYRGSDDDAALNAGVERVAADPAARRRFVADADHDGELRMPVLSAHGIGDSTVFVEGQQVLRRRMDAAGHGARLVQVYVDSSQHSYWGDAPYPALLDALLRWVEQGARPTPEGIAERCRELRAQAPAECRFAPGFVPGAPEQRFPARPVPSRHPPG